MGIAAGESDRNAEQIRVHHSANAVPRSGAPVRTSRISRYSRN
jgi:hypothetical protein